MVGSKMISVRLNLEVASDLERYAAHSFVSKNMLINRAVSSYIRLLDIIGNGDTNSLRVINSRDFQQLLEEIIRKRKVYWQL